MKDSSDDGKYQAEDDESLQYEKGKSLDFIIYFEEFIG